MKNPIPKIAKDFLKECDTVPLNDDDGCYQLAKAYQDNYPEHPNLYDYLIRALLGYSDWRDNAHQ